MQREIMRAGEKAQQVAYAELHVQVRMELGPPASRAAARAIAWLWCCAPRAGPDAGPSRPRDRHVGVGGLPGPGGIEPDEARPCGDPGRR